MSENMPNRMPEYMSKYVSDRMPDRMPEDNQGMFSGCSRLHWEWLVEMYFKLVCQDISIKCHGGDHWK